MIDLNFLDLFLGQSVSKVLRVEMYSILVIITTEETFLSIIPARYTFISAIFFYYVPYKIICSVSSCKCYVSLDMGFCK
jgi:hypothetical protein